MCKKRANRRPVSARNVQNGGPAKQEKRFFFAAEARNSCFLCKFASKTNQRI
jgi:hypothetical protein